MTQKHTTEEISEALAEFNKNDVTVIPEILEDYLVSVAKTGETQYPWPSVSKLFARKLDKTIVEFSREFNMDILPPAPNVENVTFDIIRQRILAQLETFVGAPFTIQRLCEMVTNPRSHYKRTDKFLRAIEKNVNVVTTVDPNGKKIVCETKPLLNGLEEPAPPNLPPTYSAAPWAPATVWPSPPAMAPLLHTTLTTGAPPAVSPANGHPQQNDIDMADKDESAQQSETRTLPDSTNPTDNTEQSISTTSQSQPDTDASSRLSDQSASSNDSDDVTSVRQVNNEELDVRASLTSGEDSVTVPEPPSTSKEQSESPPVPPDQSAAADQTPAVAMVTESSVDSGTASEPLTPSSTPLLAASSHQSSASTMADTEIAETRPGKRESTDTDDGLVSPAKRMCLEKDAAILAEVTDVLEDGAPKDNGTTEAADNQETTEATDDVTSTAEVTNGDHVEETTNGDAAHDDASKEPTQSEDSNDSEALTTSSEESAADQPPADSGDVTEKTDDVTAGNDDVATGSDDVSKDEGGGAAADSAEDQ